MEIDRRIPDRFQGRINSSQSLNSRFDSSKKNNSRFDSSTSTSTSSSSSPCHRWIRGEHCRVQNRCKFLHSHHTLDLSDQISFLTKLSGHSKAITGISFPANSSKLYSSGLDKKLVLWDSITGKGQDIPLDGEVGCMTSHGSIVFVGIPNAIKMFDAQSTKEVKLDGPKGQVHAMTVTNGMLIAGCQDGRILVWKHNEENNALEASAVLEGHSGAVVSLASGVGGEFLFSGSMDNTINVWNLETSQLIQTLRDHSSVVMSLLCCNNFLFSSSLDQTVKVWVISSDGTVSLTYSHMEKHGVLALQGMNDSAGNAVLACSCNDNTVRLYELPSFKECGRLFSREEVRVSCIGPGGLYFTGDGSGEVRVWQWQVKLQTEAAQSVGSESKMKMHQQSR